MLREREYMYVCMYVCIYIYIYILFFPQGADTYIYIYTHIMIIEMRNQAVIVSQIAMHDTHVYTYLYVCSFVRCSSGGPGSEQDKERAPLKLISLLRQQCPKETTLYKFMLPVSECIKGSGMPSLRVPQRNPIQFCLMRHQSRHL